MVICLNLALFSSQYDFCVSKRDQGSTLSAMPSSGIESITICSDKTDGKWIKLREKPRTLFRSNRECNPATSDSTTIEWIGDTIESGQSDDTNGTKIKIWTWTKRIRTVACQQVKNGRREAKSRTGTRESKSKRSKRKRYVSKQRTNLKTCSAEKAKWAHVEWLQQKEKENKEKAEKEKKRKQVNEKMKTKTEQG